MILMLWLLWLATVSLAFDYPHPGPNPIINTPLGLLQGRPYTTFSGKNVSLFLGVQYAAQSPEELRFEKAKLIDSWAEANITMLADEWPVYACHVHHRVAAIKNITYVENCHFMNIITPQEKRDEGYPILVYIHGGGFEIGNLMETGFKHAAENFVTKDLIFVSIQYRLGFLGFMTNGKSSLPGNIGLWDQTLALEFIQLMLPSFGGDVNRITLMGSSAGSASISALMASPHSNTYFAQAIQLSGSIFSPWAYGENVVEVSSRLSAAVGCDFKDKSTLKNCLKSKTIDNFYEAMESVGSGRHHPEFMIFHPHLDYDFFPEPVEKLLAKAPKKKTIQGLTTDESGIFTLLLDIPGAGDLYIPQNMRESFSRKDLQKFLEIITSDMGAEGGKLAKLAMNFYANNSEDDPIFFMRAYTDILSDLQFNVPVQQEIELKIKNKWETFTYFTSHSKCSAIINSAVGVGATHGEEMPFMLEYFGFENLPLTTSDGLFKRILLDFFISFVKTGTPVAEKIVWKSTNKNSPGIRFNLSSNPILEKFAFRQDANRFWLEEVPSIVNQKTLKDKLLPGLELASKTKGEL